MVHFRKFNPYKHHRRSIRLQNWDYSSPGIYFVTMRVQSNSVYFGQKFSGKLELNDLGKIVAESWMDIINHYENVELDEWIVMPDHFHGIIIIRERTTDKISNLTTIHVGAIHESPRQQQRYNNRRQNHLTQEKKSNITSIEYRNKRRKMLLSKIIGRFKMVSAKQINLHLHSSGKIWQRDYFECIVRNKDSLARIRNYIKSNPDKL